MLQQYQQQVASGQLQFDPRQWFCLQQLHNLAMQLTAVAQPSQATAPKGIYLYGPVGRGKTMLMDSFYQHLATDRKIRLHFHHFMARVHPGITSAQRSAGTTTTDCRPLGSAVSGALF